MPLAWHPTGGRSRRLAALTDGDHRAQGWLDWRGSVCRGLEGGFGLRPAAFPDGSVLRFGVRFLPRDAPLRPSREPHAWPWMPEPGKLAGVPLPMRIPGKKITLA